VVNGAVSNPHLVLSDTHYTHVASGDVWFSQTTLPDWEPFTGSSTTGGSRALFFSTALDPSGVDVSAGTLTWHGAITPYGPGVTLSASDHIGVGSVFAWRVDLSGANMTLTKMRVLPAGAGDHTGAYAERHTDHHNTVPTDTATPAPSATATATPAPSADADGERDAAPPARVYAPVMLYDQNIRVAAERPLADTCLIGWCARPVIRVPVTAGTPRLTFPARRHIDGGGVHSNSGCTPRAAGFTRTRHDWNGARSGGVPATSAAGHAGGLGVAAADAGVV
jgi:hypothetical protein